MKRYLIIIIGLLTSVTTTWAQSAHETATSLPVSRRFADGTGPWFLQAGLDMSLQHPYGYDFRNTFPNGKTFGLNAALGRWFTPELGLRLRLNWENGLRPFENHHANWLAPMNQPGINMDRGGYLTFVGDVPFNLLNLIRSPRPQRPWDLSLFPRAGVAYNFGVSKGSPLLGLGLQGTFRLNRHIGLYLDAAYQFVSSGFTPVGTGTGTAANAFMDLSLGIQYNIGKTTNANQGKTTDTTEENTTDIIPAKATAPHAQHFSGVNSPSLTQGWFLQAAWDMTLHKTYRQNFSQVFPKGRTMGFNGAIGRHFSSEIALRARLNWENGFPLFENRHLEWIPGHKNPDGTITPNMDKGGYITAGLDVMINAVNFLGFYRPDRCWDLYGFARAGLGSNLAIQSASPMVGAGLEATYRLHGRISLYADLAYQAITSEFYDYISTTGMSVSTGHNGFFDLSLGVQIDLGKKKR